MLQAIGTRRMQSLNKNLIDSIFNHNREAMAEGASPQSVGGSARTASLSAVGQASSSGSNIPPTQKVRFGSYEFDQA